MSTPLKSKVYQWLNIAQYGLLPGICVLCQQATKRKADICLKCAVSLPVIHAPCPRCALPLPHGSHQALLCGGCLSNPPPFKYIFSAFEYYPPINHLISDFKFYGKLPAGKVLASLMLPRLLEFYADKTLPDLLIPVPLHLHRIRHRGYNQALELARYMGKHLDINVNPSYCIRHHNTHSQTGLSAIQRKHNLRHAFGLKFPDRKSPQTIAIVDDVVTTMATASELSWMLLKNGTQEVHIWTLARTDK